VETIEEAKQAIRSSLGKKAKDTFDTWVNEFMHYVKSLSMEDLKTPENIIEDEFLGMCRGIIVESIKAFLNSRQVEDNSFTINVSKDHVVYDKNMDPLPEILAIKETQEEIVSFLLSSAMKEFKKGRRLFSKMVKRSNDFTNKDRKTSRPIKTPFESIEIEVIRLENRLLELSPEETTRLIECYKIIRSKRDS
jgi:hypothetical protein